MAKDNECSIIIGGEKEGGTNRGRGRTFSTFCSLVGKVHVHGASAGKSRRGGGGGCENEERAGGVI